MALIETNKPDNLIAGNNQPIEIQIAKIDLGEGKLKRGTVLCYKSAIGGACGAYKSAIKDKARFILGEDVDTTSAAANAEVIASGNINESAISVGTGETLSETGRDALRNAGIFLVNGLK